MTNQNAAAAVSDAKPPLNTAAITKQKPPTPPGKHVAISSSKKKNLLHNLEINTKVNAWVDSMRASSPTHIHSHPSDDDANSHGKASWTEQHPSALDMFEKITNASKGKSIIMFLDYDGTLSPIVEDSDRAFMSEGMRTTVRKLARYFPTAIVSGRCRDKVYDFVRLGELYYAGSHGMDIKGPSKTSKHNKEAENVLYQPASDYLPMIDEVHKMLLEVCKNTEGAKVENNKFCVSVHFRCVDEKKWSELAKHVGSVLDEYPKLRVTQGRKVLEIRPTIKWDKGKALEFLLESLGYANRADVFPIYIGDDKTDEDAFKVIKERGQGFGILVSTTPKDTNASFTLQEPSEVMAFLRRLVEWKGSFLRRQFTMRRQLEVIDHLLPN